MNSEIEKVKKIKSLLVFYKNKLKNSYYQNEEEKIFLEEKIKHLEKLSKED